MKYLQLLVYLLGSLSIYANPSTTFDSISIEKGQVLDQNISDLSNRQIEQALQLALESLTEAKKVGNLELLAESHKILSNIYSAKEEYKSAIIHTKYQSLIQDSIRRIANEKYILGLELQEQVAEKEMEAKLLQNENASIYAQEKENKTSSLMVICLLALSIAIAVHLNNNKINAQKVKTILQNEVKIQTADLVAINNKLKKQNKHLERFAYITSHDLKEPLKNINSFLGLIENEMKEEVDKDTLDYFGFIRKNTNQMANLVEGILAYSKIGKVDITKTSIDLNQATNDVIKSLQSLIDEKEGLVTYDQLPIIKCDAESWNILLYHLIDNGLKYNESEKPKVHISFHSYPDRNVVAVKDNGIGIEEAYYQQALTIFQRLHNRQIYNGAGIGLAICNKIVKNLNGHIQIDSVVGKGSTFNLVFPVTQES